MQVVIYSRKPFDDDDDDIYPHYRGGGGWPASHASMPRCQAPVSTSCVAPAPSYQGDPAGEVGPLAWA